MNHLVVYAHPNAESFNHAILETVVRSLQANGHRVVVRDLYALRFQPVLGQDDLAALDAGDVPADILAEQELIAQADAITLIYPIWWGGQPAMLKGYIDRVFSHGFAYVANAQGIERLLEGKKGLIINTHGTPKDIYDQTGMTEGLKLTIDTAIFSFVGIETVGHLLFGGIGYGEEETYNGMLKEVEEAVVSLFPAR
ncbi:UNVERIFIED_CONTAM: NAD(P)H dehydrogenase (quinone) [Brevibacillus sp. OAP136]